MKFLFSTIALMTFAFVGCQTAPHEVDVPAAVQAIFKSLYPEVKDVKWEEEDGHFEADFKVNSIGTEVQFLPDGRLSLTETKMEVSTLPSTIVEYFNQNMPGKKISEVSRLVNADGIVSYEAEVDGIDYLFDQSGTFTSQEVEEEKGEDK